ncbi:hypothetical protein N9A56_03505 [Planktomarina temperata]|nr:hypothetical protein [Planktomarina temperata]
MNHNFYTAQEQHFLEGFFECLGRQGVNYVMLRGHDGFPEKKTGHDIDLYIPETDVRNFENLLQDNANKHEFKFIFRDMHHYGGRVYWCFLPETTLQKLHYVVLHVFTEVNWLGLEFLNECELKNYDLFQENYRRLNAVNYLKMLLVIVLPNGPREKYIEQVNNLLHNNKSLLRELRDALNLTVGRSTTAEIINDITSKKLTQITRRRRKIQAAYLLRKFLLFRNWLAFTRYQISKANSKVRQHECGAIFFIPGVKDEKRKSIFLEEVLRAFPSSIVINSAAEMRELKIKSIKNKAKRAGLILVFDHLTEYNTEIYDSHGLRYTEIPDLDICKVVEFFGLNHRHDLDTDTTYEII